LIAIKRLLQSNEPVAEEAEPKFGQSTVVVLDDGGYSSEGIVVLVEEPLVVWVLKVALRHGVHVVEAKVLVVRGEEAVLGGLMRNNIGEIEAVLHFAGAPNTGRHDDNVCHNTQYFDGRL